MTLQCSLSIVITTSSRNTAQPEAEAAARAKKIPGPVMSLVGSDLSVWGITASHGAKVLLEASHTYPGSHAERQDCAKPVERLEKADRQE